MLPRAPLHERECVALGGRGFRRGRPGAVDLMNTLEILRDLIRIDTQNPPGNERDAADYIVGLCREFGLEHQVQHLDDNRANLIVRLAPERRDRLVILGHLDVVPADAATWDHDPFSAEISNGYLYGRGALDMKYFLAVALTVLAELKPHEESLTRGITCVFSSDEENGSRHGLPLLLQDERLRDELSGRTVLNEGGGFAYTHGGKRYYLVETGQKSVARLRITVPELPDTNPYFPTLDHERALNRAIRAVRQADLRRPVPDTTRRLLERFAGGGRGVDEQLARVRADLDADGGDEFLYKLLYAMSHTMITPTRIQGGSRHPDLPRSRKSTALLDCRVLPDISEQEFTTAVRKALGHLPVDLEILSFSQGYETAFSNPIVARAEDVLKRYDPQVEACLPFITPGANDGKYLRPLGCDVLGFAPLAASQPFKEVISRIHANNERISLDSIEFCTNVMSDLCRAFVSGGEDMTSKDAAAPEPEASGAGPGHSAAIVGAIEEELQKRGIDTLLMISREDSDTVLARILDTHVVALTAVFLNASGKHVVLTGRTDAMAYEKYPFFDEIISMEEDFSVEFQRVFDRLSPRRVALNISEDDPALDGLRWGLYAQLQDILGPEKTAAMEVSSEDLLRKVLP